MSTSFGRLAKFVLRPKNGYYSSKTNLSTNVLFNSSKGKILLTTAGVLGTGIAGLVYALNESVKAEGLELHPPKYPWYHKQGLFNSLDMASVRRGYQVYKQVCAACHSMRFVAYRELVGELLTEEEAKAEAAEIMVTDGPDETGKMFQRPGKLSDYFPSPYPNEEAARAANNGAYPPDLSLIVLARHGGEDYIFSLLTGYTEAPAGVAIGEGQHFNAYFPGGAISMAQALFNGVVDYEDGTPNSASQLAKDVCNFLKWAGEINYNERMLMFMRTIIYGSVFFLGAWYMKRHTWTILKSRKVMMKPKSND